MRCLRTRIRAVVETTVAFNGNVFLTTGRTEHIFLGQLDAYPDGSIITVQARNASHVYATAIMHVRRSLEGTSNGDSLWVSFVIPAIGDEPDQFDAEYERIVDLGYTKTSYDVPTSGDRNGQFKHELVEDQLGLTSVPTDARKAIPSWETIYRINNPHANNFFYGYGCALWHKSTDFVDSKTICTDVSAYSRAIDPAGLADIVDLDVLFHAESYFITRGGAVLVSPR